jgi:hypothetical protein
MKPARFELSADTRFIRQALEAVKPGEMISYAALSKLISKTVSGQTPALQTARRTLVKDGYVFSAVTGTGFRRLTDGEIVAASGSDIAAVRRKARRAGLKLSTVSFEALTPEQQLAHAAKASIVGAVAAITTDKAVAQVEKAASGRSSELPVGETLKALGYKL